MNQQQQQSQAHLHQGGSTTSASISTASLQIEESASLPIPIEKTGLTKAPQANLNALSPIRISALIIPFSMLGLLARLGLVSIESFSGQQVFALAWPQFIGCLLMGLFVSMRSWIDQGFAWHEESSEQRCGHWIGPFIYVGLSSGLCGSITTFSSWSLGIFIELINTAKVSRHPLQNVSYRKE